MARRLTIENEAIANVPGGRKVLAKTVNKPDDLADLIRRGLRASSVRTLAGKGRRNKRDMSNVTAEDLEQQAPAT